MTFAKLFLALSVIASAISPVLIHGLREGGGEGGDAILLDRNWGVLGLLK